MTPAARAVACPPAGTGPEGGPPAHKEREDADSYAHPNRGPLIFIGIVGAGAVCFCSCSARSCSCAGRPARRPEELQATGAAQTVAAQLTQVALEQTIAPPPPSNTPAPPTDTPLPPVTNTPQPPTVTPTLVLHRPGGVRVRCHHPGQHLHGAQPGVHQDLAAEERRHVHVDHELRAGLRLEQHHERPDVAGPGRQRRTGRHRRPVRQPDLAGRSNGTHRGNWKLRNDKGTIFGLGGGGPFYVQIIVGPTPTSGPSTYKATSFTVRQTWHGDLDSGTETSTGDDFWYEAVSAAEKYISPQNGAKFLKMGGVPDYSDCKDAALSSNKINLNTFPAGSWMCYKTSDDRYGRFQLDSFGDPNGTTMYIDMRTWNK